MQSANTKFYLAFLLVGLCIVHAVIAAPTDVKTEPEAEPEPTADIDSSNEVHKTSVGDVSTAASIDLKSDAVQVPGNIGIHQQPMTLQMSPPKSGSPVTTHVRVKRNKNPIRYHAKNIRRQ